MWRKFRGERDYAPRRSASQEIAGIGSELVSDERTYRELSLELRLLSGVVLLEVERDVIDIIYWYRLVVCIYSWF